LKATANPASAETDWGGVQTYANFFTCWNNQPVLTDYLLTCRHLINFDCWLSDPDLSTQTTLTTRMPFIRLPWLWLLLRSTAHLVLLPI